MPKLHPYLVETLHKNGCANVKLAWRNESDGARFEIDDVQAEALAASIAGHVCRLRDAGVDPAAFEWKIHDAAEIEIGRPQYGDGQIITLPLMQPISNRDPSRDLPFLQLLHRFELGAGLVEALAPCVVDGSVARISRRFRYDTNVHQRFCEARVKTEQPAWGPWLAYAREFEDVPVELAIAQFQTWNFVRTKHLMRIEAWLGSSFASGADRVQQVEAFIARCRALQAPLDPLSAFTFKLFASGGDIGGAGPTVLQELPAVVSALAEHIAELELGDAGPQHVLVELGATFTVTHDCSQRHAEYRVPSFDYGRCHEFTDRAAVSEALLGDVARARRVHAWMTQLLAGKVAKFEIASHHAHIAMKDAHLDALIEALSTHLATVAPPERGAWQVTVQDPTAYEDGISHNNIRIKLPDLDTADLATFLSTWFAEHLAV